MNDDVRLLREYATTRSDAAFAEVVRRYVDFVYSSARRQVGEPNLAEDVTQAVFIVLAKRAGSLPADRPLSTWLLKTTSYCAANARRARGRRNNHERKAAEMASKKDSTEQQWESLSPLLDEGLSSLRGADRDALLMKFFEKKSLQQVGEALGVSEDAAQKRVTRAVERLRDFFHARGATTISASTLATLLIAESTKTAPATLAASLTATATTATAGAAFAKGALILMATEKLKFAVIAVLVLLLGFSGVVFVVSHSTANTSPPTAALPPATASQWPLKFSDGTFADIIAIRDPNQPDTWWSLDGTPVADPGFRASGVISMKFSTARALDVIVRMNGSTLDTKGVTINAGLPQRTAKQPAGDASDRLVKFIVPVDSGAASGSLRVGLATGPWEGELSLPCENGGSDLSGSTGAGFTFLGMEEKNGRTLVRMMSAMPAVPEDREVVVISGGKELETAGTLSSGNVYTFTYRCRLSEAQRIVARSRRYEWVELRNVAFDTTTPPTKVELGGATSQPVKL